MNIECSSSVARVVVHARGALVTRDVALPADLPSGIVDIAVPGVTLHAEAGSARASLEESERVVSAVHTAVVLPTSAIEKGPTRQRVHDLGMKAARLGDELRVLGERRARLDGLNLAPFLRAIDERKRERDVLDVRFADALRAADLVREKVRALDKELARLESEQRAIAKELEAARLEDAQASAREQHGGSQPTRTITVRVTGAGRPGRLAVTYAVAAARWWPTYTLRLEDGGRRASWTFEALVAQRSGEDWSAVVLALSSADLIFDARLPELASLRFSRAQPPRRRAHRPPPSGIDEMFGPYLRFGGRAFAKTPPPLAKPIAHAIPAPVLSSLEEEESLEDAVTIANRPAANEALMKRRLSAPSAAPTGAPPPPQAAYGAQPGMGMPMSAPMSFQQQMPRKGGGLLAGIGGLFEAGGGEMGALVDEGPSEPDIVPSSAWSDHDALVLADADDAHRGRLVPRRDTEGAGGVAHAVSEVDRAAPERGYDPIASRGMFDHRYEAAGRADVPSDARVHRVLVGTAAASATLAWRTVPCETADVFREAHLVNPFDRALLGGPVDVYLDGNLLTTTTIDRIDRGGSFHCGMGVDDRIKVARNVRTEEESAGLLGGSIAVTHTVDIELTSSIAEPIKVTVLERVPVTDDKALEIKIVNAKPVPDTYDQSEREAPVRGGLRFIAPLSPHKKTNLEVVYKLVFASKLDIVGGSRRG